MQVNIVQNDEVLTLVATARDICPVLTLEKMGESSPRDTVVGAFQGIGVLSGMARSQSRLDLLKPLSPQAETEDTRPCALPVRPPYEIAPSPHLCRSVPPDG